MLKKIFQGKYLLKSLIVSFGLLAIFVVGSRLPIPMIDQTLLANNITTAPFLDVLNTVSGGNMQSFCLFALGLSPYITASIIVQLLQFDVVPKLTQWSKEGEQGRDKINYLTRILALLFGFIQALTISIYMNAAAQQGVVEQYFAMQWANFAYVAFLLTIGMAFLIWLADQITKRGLGNGVSLIIAMGIITALPTTLGAAFQPWDTGDVNNYINDISLSLFFIGIILLTVVMSEATRKIPIRYTNKKIYSSNVENYLPLRINSAGVIPVIFALTILTLPTAIASYFASSNEIAMWISINLAAGTPIFILTYVILVIAFSFFYVIVQINPERVSENLNKSGAFIPSVRPGKDTEKYVKSTLMKLTFFGSIFLALIAVLPYLAISFFGLPSSVQIGGTSLLIVVSVALDVYRRIRTRVENKNYDMFLN